MASEADKAEVVVTPEMIEAGVEAFRPRFYDFWETAPPAVHAALVSAVFRAMWSAR